MRIYGDVNENRSIFLASAITHILYLVYFCVDHYCSIKNKVSNDSLVLNIKFDDRTN